jgi:predicted regulator of Ras-like GTPase activity (Roadblock/LC7/MglB family)
MGSIINSIQKLLSGSERIRTVAYAMQPAYKTTAQQLEPRFRIQPSISERSSSSPNLDELNRAEIENKLWEMFGDAPVESAEPVAAKTVPQLGKLSNCDLPPAPDNGHITDIGKFLLDPNAVNVLEQVISSGRVPKFVNCVSPEQQTALLRLQNYVLKQPYVLSTIVFAHDGTVMSSRGGTTAEIDAISSWALCAYVNSRIAAELIGAKQLKHIVLSGDYGTIILSDFGQGMLVTITNTEDSDAVNILLDKLEALLN